MAYTPAVLSREEKEAAEIARVGLMSACPFFAHYFYAECREFFTRDIETAATDGRTIFVNPGYLASLKAPERVFVYAHEVDHAICRDPTRAAHHQKDGTIKGKPYDQEQVNICMDYVRNALLLENGVGLMNPSWLYADDVTGEDVWEEVYARKFKKRPKGSGGAGKGQGQGQGGGQGPCPPGTTYSGSGKSPKGAKPDPTAAVNGGGFDQILPPPVDPVTGAEDLPDEAQFKESIARAAAAAKAMGNMPAALQKRVDDILQPQVDWREHVRMTVTGWIGSRHETWNRPNRRRLVLDPMLIVPGRRGYGAELVAVGLDTSGSIYASPKALEAFFSEVGGILADVRPKRVILIECDAKVGRVSEASTLDELEYTKSQGVTGGGGTRFEPVFEHLVNEGLVPDTMIYLTDLMGSFPKEAPPYPVVWCSIMDGTPPFGEVVRIDESKL